MAADTQRDAADLHRLMIGSTGSDDHYPDTAAERSDEPQRPRIEIPVEPAPTPEPAPQVEEPRPAPANGGRWSG